LRTSLKKTEETKKGTTMGILLISLTIREEGYSDEVEAEVSDAGEVLEEILTIQTPARVKKI
jgi:hypothetical protein